MADNQIRFGQDLEIRVIVHENVSKGIILEFEFHGIHDHMWPHGKEIYSYLEKETDKHKPDAVLLNYLQYQYTFGNELGGTIMIPILNMKEKRIRPCAIVADGPTAKSLQSLMVASDIRRTINIEMFGKKEFALEYLERLLSQSP